MRILFAVLLISFSVIRAIELEKTSVTQGSSPTMAAIIRQQEVNKVDGVITKELKNAEQSSCKPQGELSHNCHSQNEHSLCLEVCGAVCSVIFYGGMFYFGWQLNNRPSL